MFTQCCALLRANYWLQVSFYCRCNGPNALRLASRRAGKVRMNIEVERKVEPPAPSMSMHTLWPCGTSSGSSGGSTTGLLSSKLPIVSPESDIRTRSLLARYRLKRSFRLKIYRCTERSAAKKSKSSDVRTRVAGSAPVEGHDGGILVVKLHS